MIGQVRRWATEPDHYYWITAVIAARGEQRVACRRMSLVVFAFSALAFAMLFSPEGPRGPVNRGIALAGVVVTVMAALWWLRRRWPTRTQSLVFVGVSALGILVAAWTQSNPVAGFVASSSFAALCGYVVFFHTPRYLYPVLSVAAITLVVLAVRVAGEDVVWACVLVASVAAILLPVAVICGGFVRLLQIDLLDNDIESLTGLLNLEALYAATGALIGARHRWHESHLLFVVVGIDNFSALTGMRGRVAGERARVALAQTLRENTRNNVAIAHTTDSEFIVVDTGSASDWQPLTERIRSAVRTTPPNTSVSIGVATVPLDGLVERSLTEVVDTLTAVATSAMHEARGRGGNQVHHIACPRTGDPQHDHSD